MTPLKLIKILLGTLIMHTHTILAVESTTRTTSASDCLLQKLSDVGDSALMGLGRKSFIDTLFIQDNMEKSTIQNTELILLGRPDMRV